MPEKPSYEELEKRVGALERNARQQHALDKERLMVLEILRLINETESLRDLLEGFLHHMRSWSGCEAIGIRIKDGPDFPYFVTQGFPDTFVELERQLCSYGKNGEVKRDQKGEPILECMCGNIIKERYDPSKNFFTEDGCFWSNCTTDLIATTTDTDRQARTRNRCNGEGYESVALIPLRSAGETFGLLQLNDHEKGCFSAESIAMFRRLADHIAGFLAKRRASKALEESEARLRTLIDTLPDMVWLKNPEGVYLACNPRFEKFFGAREAEIIGKTDYDFLDRELADFFQEKDRAAVAAGRPCTNEEEVTFADDGHREILETIKSPIYSTEGDIAGVLGIARDITPRKESEQMLMESREQLRLFIQHSPAAMAMFDRDMRYLAVSSRWIEDFRLEDEDLIGRFHYEIFPEIAEDLKEIHRRGMAGETFRADEECFQRQDGTVNWLRWELRPWHRVDGTVGGIIILTEDITRRKLAEIEHENLQEMLAQAQKMESVGRLAGGVAHDLNNLLSPILGYSDILMEELGKNDGRRAMANEILSAGMRARVLVRQLLAFSRKQTLEFKSMDLGETIDGFQKLLRRTIPEDIRIDIASAPGLPPVLADVGQIEQVIMNLSVNAADAMPNGGVLTIETSKADLDEDYSALHPEVEAGAYSLLAISDSGYGMEEETRKQIFEPFFSTKGERGTGLGLATVYGIVKQHRGHIWVYSEPGQGTTFKIYLPVSTQRPASDKAPGPSPENLSGSETILLVEDDEQVRRLAQSILERRGYNVIAAKNSAEAEQALASRHGPVDLMLTDVVMPGLNGRQLYELALGQRPALKVLYMSGYTDDVIAHRGILEEGIQFIQKPFSNQALATKVREVLDLQ